MDDFLRYQRRILTVSLVLAALGMAGLAVCMDDPRWAAGLGLGAATGLLKVRLDVLAILRWSRDDGQGGPRPLVKSHFMAYGITAAALLTAALVPAVFSIWTVAAGRFLPDLVLMADGVFHPELMAGRRAAGEGTADA